MTAEEVMLGVALTLILAVGSQILAVRLRIPALVVLLPVGFAAGALTDLVNPNKLLGSAFEPLVSLAVAVILYEAGLNLDLRRLRDHPRRVVRRLVTVGAGVTWILVTLLALSVLGMSFESALMIGAILVVSGPTVVGPLLHHVRPTDRIRQILAWEGTLIDPVGAILGALVFHAITTQYRPGSGILGFSASIGIGLLGGAIGAGLLWLILRRLRPGEVLGTLAQLAVVIGVAAVCDTMRDDSGLVAAIVVGLALANLPGFDVAAARPFLETLVQLTLGLLFISISATITPQSLSGLILPTLAFVAVLVLAVRPLVALLSTWRSDLSNPERAFIGWMAPRGIVAAATAASFAPVLVDQGLAGAQKILPCTFLVIVMTVTLYGLTAAPVSRLLGVVRKARSRPLLVGGQPWVVDLGKILRERGIEVVMWAGPAQQRQAIQAAGIELAPDDLFADVARPTAEVEGLTGVLLLSEEDDFNALAATLMDGNLDGPVYRIGPPPESHGVPSTGDRGSVLFGPTLTRDAIAARHAAGDRITITDAATDADVLCRIRSDGSLHPFTHEGGPSAMPGDALVAIGGAR